MSKGEFLLEVRCEEIPARMLRPALRELGTRLFEELMSRGMGPDEIVTGSTPRRLVLALRGVPRQEPDRSEQLLGPPTRVAWDEEGQPTPALLGFSRKAGVAPEELQRVTNAKGEYLSAVRTTPGQPATEVLRQIVPPILTGLKWPKTMRWGSDEGPWVRPVHGVVAVFDGEVVPLELFGIASGDETCGHPVLSPDPFSVSDWKSYSDGLDQRGLVIGFEERRRAISDGLLERTAELGGNLVEDPALLDKLTAICEIPGVVSGTFDEAYLDLPREVLVTALRDHQSAFTVERDGTLMPCFLTVMDRPDDPAGRVRAGNEWVVDARLADARFFLDEDRKTSLADRRRRLEHLTFHVDLGSYADKVERLESLAATVCDALGWEESRKAAVLAAGLLKSDLDTEMVREFTSLQGIVGGVYARSEGHSEEVWKAIYEQYRPASGDDPIPADRIGRIVGLADRIDTLAGMFGIGLAPTGSKDPFGLRRAAQGAVRIAMEGEMEIDLEALARGAVTLYGDRLRLDGDRILELLRPFLNDRVRHLLGARGFAYDEVAAVLGAGSRHLPDLEARITALHEARDREGFLAVVLAAKRIANILRDSDEQSLDPEALIEPAALELHRATVALEQELLAAEEDQDYAAGLGAIARLADVLDRFFVEVMVMDENPALRNNRIALLQRIHRLLSRTALLTEMVVDRSELRSREEEDQNPNQ